MAQTESLLSVGSGDALAEALSSDVVVGLGSRDSTRVGVGEHRLEHSVVSLLSAPSDRKLEPEDKNSLGGKIPGEVIQNRAECNAFGEVECAEHDPIGEPLNVVCMARRLERLEGEISRKAPANEIRDGSSECVEKMEDEEERDSANNEPRLGDLRTLLQVVQRGIFCELFVELGNIVVGFGLRLLEGGMLLDIVGHLGVK